MSNESIPSPRKALLVVISAPSGGGKTTVCQRILASNPNVVRAVTCTTRPARQGERDGVDYHFLQPARFDELIAEGAFLEHATVYAHQYGTLKSEILGYLRAGRDVLLSVDVQGAATIISRASAVEEIRGALVTVFLTPPRLEILEERLRGRGQDGPESMARRLGTAREEIARWREFEYLIISDSMESDADRLRAIMTAEKLRRERATDPVVGRGARVMG